MARTVPAAILTALTQPEVAPFYAVEMLFDVRTGTDLDGNPFTYGPIRLWTGYGDRVIDGQTYQGAGDLLTISGLEEVNDLSAKAASITISGIPSEYVALALKEPYQRRTCRILWGVTNVSDFVEVFSGKMNQMPIEDSGESSVITILVESKLVELGRALVRRYTHESQQSRYPGDTFFSFVADIQDKGIPWGRKEE
jgi:hypothetical protein